LQISRDGLLQAYRRMRTIRVFEERIHIENRTGEIAGFIHLYAGQEAVAVGVCEHLSDSDYIASTHRGHGHCIAKGCDVPGMMMEIYGRHGGLCKGRGGSMHIADLDKGMLGANAIVGGGPPIAVGAAVAAKIRRDGTVAVSFIGDGASNQGTVFEAMNLAVVLKVPKIFVFENNGYGEHTAASYAVGSGDIAARAEAFGMPVFRADGFDFFSVYDAAREAVEWARSGKGPCAIYAECTRYGGHFEGDPQAYREKGEVERLKSLNDCLQNFRRRVVESHLLDTGELDALDAEVDALIERATAEAKQAPPPPVSELLADVYVSY
jgi:acetoin:2,6-dichlorophenolindophenol oxidoreductase subunit alpha